MAGALKSASGLYVAVASRGWPYPETMRFRKREARKAMGEILIGMTFDGVKIENHWQGWDRARKQGYQIVKVDVVPHVE